MTLSKKPFYKRIGFWLLSFGLGIIIIFLIPYGLEKKSLGGQLWDTLTQASELYVYDEKEHWTEEEWNDYWKEHPEYGADTTGMDWESFPEGSTADDARLDELPPDYSKLWKIDFSDLEETEQYNAWLDEPIVDEGGKPLREEFIYREKSTGDLIVDVTLDGFILRLDPSYHAGWNIRSNSDPNGFNKYEKAMNLQIIKKLGDQSCRVDIAPNDWAGPVYNNEQIAHPEYELTMRHDAVLDSPEDPRRFLTVKLDEAPYNTDTYAIRINSTSPKECFDANVEMEILKGMTFLPPELKEQGLDYDELHRFPEPYYWPKPLKEEVKVTQDESSKKQIVEYDGYRLELDPKWKVQFNKAEKNEIAGFLSPVDSVGIAQSRRCSTGVSDIMPQYQNSGAKSIEEYYGLSDELMDELDMGILKVETAIEKIAKVPYETYKVETKIDIGDDYLVSGGYNIIYKGRLIQISWTVDNRFEDIRRGDCNAFGEAVFEGFNFLE